jgi:hypothetical protein
MFPCLVRGACENLSKVFGFTSDLDNPFLYKVLQKSCQNSMAAKMAGS